MSKEKLKIEELGLELEIEPFHDSDYISITQIAKNHGDPNYQLIIRWIQNSDTLLFLETWEKTHNPNFKLTEMSKFRLMYQEKRHIATPQKYIKATGAIGIISKSGRYGGTFAHKEIALHFCYWLSPAYQVFFYKAFTKLLEERAKQQNLKWHISKITDNIDEVRNLLDTIPYQNPERNRLKENSPDNGGNLE